MNLADVNTVRKILSENGFSFKKALGQNFIVDGSVCPDMAKASCDENTGVLEIGPGFGVLTAECAALCKKVVALEIDEKLKPVLDKTLKDFSNIEIVFGDALKLDLNKFISEKFKDCKNVAVCANLPYYITSPLIIKLLSSRLNVKNITVMVQKEAAERICAKVGTRQAGVLSVYVSYYAQSKILFDVDKNSFMPPPKVDSSVIQLMPLKAPAINVRSEEEFFKFVKAAFEQRRKTFCNSLSNTLGIDKQTVKSALNELCLNESIRSEMLTMKQLEALYNKLF